MKLLTDIAFSCAGVSVACFLEDQESFPIPSQLAPSRFYSKLRTGDCRVVLKLDGISRQQASNIEPHPHFATATRSVPLCIPACRYLGR